MRYGLCVLPLALLAGCATSSDGGSSSFATRSKLAEKVALINQTKRNLKTASCKQIDEAMAYSYLLRRAPVDKQVFETPNDAAKGVSLIYKAHYEGLQKEYASRCKKAPLQTIAVQKLYPDLMREAKRRVEEKKAAEAKQASR